MDKQHPMCGKIHLLKWDNRDRIRKLIQSTYPDKLTHDEWLSIVNELEDRINWQEHLAWNAWASYVNADYFEPEEVRLTLDDYIYDRRSI